MANISATIKNSLDIFWEKCKEDKNFCISPDTYKAFKSYLLQSQRELLLALVGEIEKMKKANIKSLDVIPEKTEIDKITNLLNKNLVIGYQQALSNLRDLLRETIEKI